jgi:hypothetical protein
MTDYNLFSEKLKRSDNTIRNLLKIYKLDKKLH